VSKFPNWSKCTCNKPGCKSLQRECANGGKIIIVPEWAGYSAMCIPETALWTPRPVSYEKVLELTEEWAKQKGGWKS
jgi:hypothetical protein